MVELSRGGGDTSTWREFDTTIRRFVPAGFSLPEAKSNLDWSGALGLLGLDLAGLGLMRRRSD